METITITEAHAVVFGPDGLGSETIVNLLKLEVLDIPKSYLKSQIIQKLPEALDIPKNYLKSQMLQKIT